MVEFNRSSLVYIVTVPMSAWSLLAGQLSFFKRQGFDVHIISSPGKELEKTAEREGVLIQAVPIQREISLFQDVLSLYQLWAHLRKLRPQVVNVGTPKAGLLGGIAAVLARIPVRVYVLHGLRLETAKGFKRQLLTLAERIACACAHSVICVSPSLRAKAVELQIVSSEKAVVFRSGSCNGIQVERFLPTVERQQRAQALREQLNIPEGALVIGFVGRFTRDKGINELIEACLRLFQKYQDVYLLLVGRFEEGDPLPRSVHSTIETHPKIINAGFTGDVAPYYLLMDVLALPTHREGLGNVLLEAATAGKPTVTTTATGAVDAVVDGVTGLTVPVGNADALTDALSKLIESADVRSRMGKAGQERVRREFVPERIWEDLDNLYRELYAQHSSKLS